MQQETIHLQRAAPQVRVTTSGAMRLCPDERAALCGLAKACAPSCERRRASVYQPLAAHRSSSKRGARVKQRERRVALTVENRKVEPTWLAWLSAHTHT